MQAATTKSTTTTAKTTPSATTTKKLSSISNNNNNNNNNVVVSGSKSRVLKKTTPTAGSTVINHPISIPNASAIATATASSSVHHQIDPNGEIEELSKKITEHADALYRTWRIRGLAPTELPEIYTTNPSGNTTNGGDGNDFFGGATNAASAAAIAAAAAAAAAASGTTENLQQLVNTFIIKDKEQRGVKGTKKTTTAEISSSKTTTLKKPAGQKVRAKSPTATSTSLTTSAGITTPKTTTTSNTKNESFVVQKKQQIETTPKKSSTSVKATSQSTLSSVTAAPLSPSPPPSSSTAAAATLDVNLNFDLNLLTKQQTENLLKISEILQKEQEKEKSATKPMTKKTATTTTTKIEKDKDKEGNNISSSSRSITGGRKIATSNLSTTTSATEPIKTNPLKATSTSKGTTTINSKTIANNKLLKNNVDSVDATTTATPTTFMSARDRATTANAAELADPITNTSTNTAKTKSSSTTTSDKISASNNNKRSTSPAPAIKSNAEESKLQSAKLVKAISSGTSVVSSKDPSNTTTSQQDQQQPTGTGISLGIGLGLTSIETSPQLRKITKDKSGGSGGLQQRNTLGTKSSKAGGSTETSPNFRTTGNTTIITSVAGGGGVANGSMAGAAASEVVTAQQRTTMPTLNKVKPTSGRAPLTNGQDKNLGRPILTRGSVAERVLMFEKCPDVRNSFLNIKRPDIADTPPKSLLKVKLHATPPSSQQEQQTALQREISFTKYIPRFYFPHGKPQPTIAMERVLRGILGAFDSFPNNQVTKDELPRILKLCGLPFYWRMPVMVFCQPNNSGLIERQRFVEFWKQMNVYCHDAESRFVYILSRGQRFRSYIVPEDLVPMVQDVVDTHPGLAFLKEATEFHSRYVHTVIARIFYSVNRSWSGKITIAELKRSDLLEMITLLEEEDDINQIMAFFSYEHFYVIYCKFWELDKDHDLLINQEDLARHSDHALSTRIVERIFSGCVTRNDNKKPPNEEPKMSYTDFVWFILSEEDKRTPTAIEYWFRCMDVDGDGALSMYELEYFYEEQQQRMEGIGIECLPFEDCLCQMLDMIKPKNRDCITLGDLKHCKMTHVFFDTFFNLEKYLDHEQRDPFASQRDEYTSDWDRFAAQEYELLITEEND